MEKDKYVDGTAIGLLGFVIVTALGGADKLGFTDGYSIAIFWGFALGGFAQLIAGIMDFRNGNLHGGTIFTSFGLYWLAVPFTWMTTMAVFGPIMYENVDATQSAIVYGIYSAVVIYYIIGALTVNKILFVNLIFVECLLFSQTMISLGINPDFWLIFGGWTELIASALAFYTIGAIIINHQFNREILPKGQPFIKLD